MLSQHTPYNHRLLLLCIVLALAVGLALGFTHPARADIAPPIIPPSGNLGPNQTTQVKMISERVVLDLTQDPNAVVVTADFVMRNKGRLEEKLQVSFPLRDLRSCSDYVTSQGFSVIVNSQKAATKTITTPSLGGKDCPAVPWAAFEATFPTEKPVMVRVNYRTGISRLESKADFGYILETGAGWKGSIGSADIILRLPYLASSENILSKTAPGYRIKGKELQWHWNNLEPTAANNVFVSTVNPEIWKEILDLRAQIRKKPADAEAWTSLAEKYQYAGTFHYWEVTNPRFTQLAIQTFQQAIRLQPDSADLHAKLGWLYFILVQDSYPAQLPALSNPAMRRVQHEIDLALALDSKNGLANDLKDIFNRMAPE